jgi:hypothetical protein
MPWLGSNFPLAGPPPSRPQRLLLIGRVRNYSHRAGALHTNASYLLASPGLLDGVFSFQSGKFKSANSPKYFLAPLS